MNVLKIALIACAMSAAVAQAQAQTQTQATLAAPQQEQVAQAYAPRANGAFEGRATAPGANKTKVEECVGPVSFCAIYFGS